MKYELGYLQICLEGEQMPRRATLMNFIQEGIKRLDVRDVRLVRVYGRRKGETLFGWHDCFTLSEEPPSLIDQDIHPDNLRKLARQGDYEAIACLIDYAVEHKGWFSEVAIKDRCLKVDIFGETPPDSVVAVTLATRIIATVRSSFFSTVEIRGYGVEPELLQWLDCFENEDQEILEKSTMPQKKTLPSHDPSESKKDFVLMSKIKTWF